jgi:hypothetical protein
VLARLFCLGTTTAAGRSRVEEEDRRWPPGRSARRGCVLAPGSVSCPAKEEVGEVLSWRSRRAGGDLGQAGRELCRVVLVSKERQRWRRRIQNLCWIQASYNLRFFSFPLYGLAFVFVGPRLVPILPVTNKYAIRWEHSRIRMAQPDARILQDVRRTNRTHQTYHHGS